MKFLKKNQVIIYVIVLMLMTAGYLNYTTNYDNMDLETSSKIDSSDDVQVANVGDARLVSSNVIDTQENQNESTVEETNTTIATEVNEKENLQNNTTNETLDTFSNTNDDSNEYFIKSKLDRDSMYSQMLETYENILNSNNSLETQKQTATQEITKINETKNSIMICENLIKTKGFENCVIFVNNESVSIIIGAQELQQEKIAQIQNIISRELKADIENIHISTK